MSYGKFLAIQLGLFLSVFSVLLGGVRMVSVPFMVVGLTAGILILAAASRMK